MDGPYFSGEGTVDGVKITVKGKLARLASHD